MALSPQCQKVVAHVERWGSLNSIEAIRHYGITRLAARIHDLRFSSRAMKGISSDDLAPGFVKYVPDWEQRRSNLQIRQMTELMLGEGPAFAEINIKYAAKFSLINLKEREHA